MSKTLGASRRALMLLGGCAIAAGIAFVTSQSATAGPVASNCQSKAAPGVNWSGCTLSNTMIDGVGNLRGANFSDVDFGSGCLHSSWGMIGGTDLGYTNVTGADFSKSKGCLNVIGANMANVNLTGADMSNWEVDDYRQYSANAPYLPTANEIKSQWPRIRGKAKKLPYGPDWQPYWQWGSDGGLYFAADSYRKAKEPEWEASRKAMQERCPPDAYKTIRECPDPDHRRTGS